MAMPKPAERATSIIEELERNGCSFTINQGSMIIYDPKKFLPLNPDIKERVQERKLDMLAFLQHRALRRLLQTIEMAQPKVPNGMQEDFLTACNHALCIVGGKLWEDD